MLALEVLTVGFPFCGFKALAGALALASAHPAVRALGAALTALGAADAAINAANLAALAFRRRRAMAACALSAALPARLRDVGDSLDTVLAFTLVAVVIGGGLLPGLTPREMLAWNACVVLNVLGAGLLRLGASLRGLSSSA